MIAAIALASALLAYTPVFCKETLVWDAEPLALSYLVRVSFKGPDGIVYVQHYETEEARCAMFIPARRTCVVIVAAVYEGNTGDVYTLTSEPFEFKGCASRLQP